MPILESLLEGVTQHPRYLICFFLIVGSVVLFPFIAIIGLFVWMIARLVRAPIWLIAVLGFLMMVVAWCLGGVNLGIIHQQSRIFWSELFDGALHLSYAVLFLSALPYGLLLGALLTAISNLGIGLEQQVKRLSKGKTDVHQKTLSSKQITQRLNALNTAAYSTGTVLGVNPLNGAYVCLEDKDANLHTLAVGTTGSGKTTGIANIIESAIVRGHPVFYVDGKGDVDLARRVERFAKVQNVPYYCFSMVGESLKYNPIAFGGYTSKKDRIIELREWSEDHYRKIAEGYLQTVFRILERANISVDLHRLSQYLEPKSLYALARKLRDESIMKQIDRLESQYSEISSLIAEIHNLAESEIGHLFDCQKGSILTLDQALKENAVVYFCLQPLAFPAYAETLGKLIINDIKALMASLLAKGAPKKLFAIFDEFSVFAGDQIVNLINQGRSAGMHTVLSTQSLSDILKKGGDALLGQILNNVNNYLIQRQNNPQDAELLANLIGTEQIFQVTSQVSTLEGGTGVGSVRETREFIAHPDEVKRLSVGEGIWVSKQRFKVQRVMLRVGKI